MYENGQPISCSYFQGVKKLEYVYAENSEELISNINNLSRDYFYSCAKNKRK